MWFGYDGVEYLRVIWNYMGIPGNSWLDFSLTLTYSWFFLVYNFTFIFFPLCYYTSSRIPLSAVMGMLCWDGEKECAFYITYIKFIDFSYVNCVKIWIFSNYCFFIYITNIITNSHLIFNFYFWINFDLFLIEIFTKNDVKFIWCICVFQKFKFSNIYYIFLFLTMFRFCVIW